MASCRACSGLAKRAVMFAAVAEVGERARFLRGRFERGSCEVGTASGMGSDIVVVVWLREWWWWRLS